MTKDSYYIKRTLELAKLGKGYISPNPLVGAILVKDDRIIGKGYHEKIGESHAEIIAIESASESVKGSTLYCNLEPCCHENKKTPPCAQRVIQEGISRVVISSFDPNPKVNGQGVRLLQEAGIEVVTGVLNEENQELNRFFIKFITKKLPYITVKIAQTIDGKITKNAGEQTWITGPLAKQLVHQWRSEYDAVLVGAKTVLADNPSLTVRELPGRNPMRIILDGNLSIDNSYDILKDGEKKNTIVIVSTEAEISKIEKLSSCGCQIIQLPAAEGGKISIEKIIKKLAEMNIASVLVEGGQQIFSQFFSEDISDELKIFISPQIWNKGMSSFMSNDKNTILSFKLFKLENVGDDVLVTYRRDKI